MDEALFGGSLGWMNHSWRVTCNLVAMVEGWGMFFIHVGWMSWMEVFLVICLLQYSDHTEHLQVAEF